MDDASTHLHYRELIVDDTLRLITPDVSHAHSSLEWVREQDVVQYMGVDFPTPTIEGEQVRMNDIIDNTDAYSWMIELQGAVIGNVCINDIKETSEKQGKRAGNLTILIGSKEHWGKGIGARACAAVLQWAFFEAGFEVITGRALRENMASRKLLEKLGFEKTGTEPFDGLVNGKKSEWQNYGIYRKQD